MTGKIFEPRLQALGGPALASAAPPEQFARWIRAARPNDRMVYAVARWLPKEDIAPVLKLVRDSYDEGEVLLVQQRHPDIQGCYLYIAIRRVRRQRPAVRFVPRGVLA